MWWNGRRFARKMLCVRQDVHHARGFGFHVQGCKARYEAQQAIDGTTTTLTPPDGLAIPTSSSSKEEITLWNAAVAKQFNTDAQNMCPADRCGRTFETEAKLEQHMRSCCSQLLYERLERKRLQALEQDLGKPGSSKGGGVCCHLCGRHVLHPRSLPFHFRSCLRRFYAVEDEKQASLQNAPPPAPAVADFGDNDVVDESADESDDDSYGDDFEDEVEAEDSSRRIIRMCYCCGSTRESESP